MRGGGAKWWSNKGHAKGEAIPLIADSHVDSKLKEKTRGG